MGDIAWRVLGEFEMSPDTRWRILSATTLIPTVPLIIASCMIPESWMFLMKTREYSKATEAACLYRNNPIQGYRDVISSHFQMEAEGELIKIRKAAKTRKTKSGCDEENVPAGGAVSDETRPLSERLINGPPGLCSKSQTASSKDEQLSKCSHSYHMSEANFFKRMWLVMDDPRCRHALVSGGVVMLTQALCGINAFAFFSSSLLEAGLNPHESLKLALCFGGVSFGFGLLTPFLSDRLGRTTLALLGLPIMAIFMFILASLFALGNSAKTPSIIAVSAILRTKLSTFSSPR